MLVGPPGTPVKIYPRIDTKDAIPVQLDEETLFDAIPINHSLTYIFNTKNILKNVEGKLN